MLLILNAEIKYGKNLQDFVVTLLVNELNFSRKLNFLLLFETGAKCWEKIGYVNFISYFNFQR